MKDESRQRVLYWFTIGFALLILLVGGIVSWPDYVRGEALRKRQLELNGKIELKKREIAQLREKQRRFRTDREFLEEIAHMQNRVHPGELVFIFDN